MSSDLTYEQLNVLRGEVVIEENVFVGTNRVVDSKVIIGEGAVIGGISLVLNDVE